MIAQAAVLVCLEGSPAQAAERPALGETVFRVAPSRVQPQPSFEEMAEPELGPTTAVSSATSAPIPRAGGRPLALTPRTTDPGPATVPPIQKPTQPATVRAALPVAPLDKPSIASPTAKVEGKVVQLGAFRSRLEAEKALADWKAQVPALFAQASSPTIVAADLGEKGTYHRVRVSGFPDSRKAGDFCREYRGGGRDCYVVP